MKKIVAFHSPGRMFYMSKTEDGFFLRNRYTVIPNEFKLYSMEKIEEIFEGLCERVPECREVESIGPDQPAYSYMHVVYEDLSEHIFVEQMGVGKNLGEYISRAADYNEFYDETFMSLMPHILNIDRIRLVCSCKTEDIDVLCDAIDDMGGDDWQHYEVEAREDGGYAIARICYGVVDHEFFIVDKDGKIEKAGSYTYTKLLKDYDVRVTRDEASPKSRRRG